MPNAKANSGGGSPIYGEEIHRIALGQGIYTSELPSNIPDGFSAQAYNFVATGDSLENRVGIRPSSVDYHKTFAPPLQFPSGFGHYFTQLVYTGANTPILAWAHMNSGGVSELSFIRGDGTHDANDGYMQVTMPDQVGGICQYNNTTYFSMLSPTNGVYKVTSYNWATDAITYSSIPSASTIGLLGLFSFKDRLWGWATDRIFFTDIAATGGFPETWSTTNFIPLRSTPGFSSVTNVIPLKNTLLVFTQSGLYTILVQGTPASWIVRTLDTESISTHPQCAFESKGIVYYVNTAGVWATNGTTVTKLSGVIEDQFFLAKGKRIHMLQSYEDGMILSIAKLTDTCVDSTLCRVFYTKLEPIAWTEWGIHPPEGETNGWGTNRLCSIISVSKKVPTYLNSDPTVYCLALITDSTAASPQSCRLSLLVFDGGENKGRNRLGDLITDPLRVNLKTKFMDGGNPFSLKMNKEGMLELYTSDSRHMFSASWDSDATVGATTTVPSRTNFSELASGNSSNLIRLPSGFKFRRCAFNFSSSLQTNTSQIKVKDLAIRMNTERPSYEQVV